MAAPKRHCAAYHVISTRQGNLKERRWCDLSVGVGLEILENCHYVLLCQQDLHDLIGTLQPLEHVHCELVRGWVFLLNREKEAGHVDRVSHNVIIKKLAELVVAVFGHQAIYYQLVD